MILQSGGLLHLLQLDDEVQRRIWTDSRGGHSAGSVTQFAGNFQFDHSVFTNQLQTFGPASDHTVQREVDLFAASVGAIELFSAIQPTFVMAGDFAGCHRFFSVRLAEDAVLQAAFGFGKLFGSVFVGGSWFHFVSSVGDVGESQFWELEATGSAKNDSS